MSTDTVDSGMLHQLPLTSRPSPLNIPELLHRIFDFFTDYELTLHVIPVCRLWFLLHQHRIAREVHFDETLGYELLESALQGLPYATRLRWSSGPSIKKQTRSQQKRHRRLMARMLEDKYDDFVDTHFKRFRPVVVVKNTDVLVREGVYYTYGMGGLDGLVQGSMAPLRELVVVGSISYQIRLVPLLPFLSTLRRLELRLESTFIDMCMLMTSCPSLEALDIRGSSTIEGILTEREFKEVRQGKPLLLQSLILGHVSSYSQENVEAMLTVSPHLRELKLFNISFGIHSPDGLVADSFRLLAHIRSLSLPLEQLYISYQEEQMTGEFQSRLLELCPARSELFTWDFPLDIVNVFRQTQNTITTLELLAHGKCGPDSTLHQYLCSSPHLLHLRAPRIEYLVNHMDIHRRLTDTNGPKFNNALPAEQPRIWACSNLQTLHIGVHSISGIPSSQEHPFYEQGRVLFGYISRVTPKLRDVSFYCGRYLTMSGDVPRLALESGLCLLARLEKLERLWIAGDLSRECSKAEDIEWMMQSGHTPEMRARRQAVVVTWDKQLREESLLNDAQLQQQQQQDQEQRLQEQQDQQQKQQDQAAVEPNDADGQLQDLGLLVDVKNMIEEMDSKEGFAFWPLLRRVSIFSESAFGLSVEQECQWALDGLEHRRENNAL